MDENIQLVAVFTHDRGWVLQEEVIDFDTSTPETRQQHEVKRSDRKPKVGTSAKKCAHCGLSQKGLAAIDGNPVCHPDVGLDCYVLVTVYHHPLPCTHCHDVRILIERDIRDTARRNAATIQHSTVDNPHK